MKMLTRKILSVLCFVLVLALIVPGFSGAAGTKPRTEKSGQYEYLINKDIAGSAGRAGPFALICARQFLFFLPVCRYNVRR